MSPELGLTGASAGGHLATLAALTPVAGDPSAKNKTDRYGTSVAAVAVFFPPTDFLEWQDGKMVDLKALGPLLSVGANSSNEGALNGKSYPICRGLGGAYCEGGWRAPLANAPRRSCNHG